MSSSMSDLMGWVPWHLALLMLPQAVADLLRDEQRQRELRAELLQAASLYSRLLLRWGLLAAQAAAVVAALLGSAAVLYALFYYLVIPSRFHEQAVFLDYGHHASLSRSGLADMTLPRAVLNLQTPTHQWQASELVDAPPQTPTVLVPGVKYDVIVELDMPESRVNMDVGMFMLSTELRTQNHALLASSVRAAIVRDSHTLVRWMRVAFWAVPYALGFSDPTQKVTVLAINGFTESKQNPTTEVVVRLNNPELQVYAAKLTIIAQLTGFRYLMYHWSVPTAILVILNIAFVEALALGILYLFYSMEQLTPDASEAPLAGAMGGLKEEVVAADKGKQFEQNRSGGIPPVHVERIMKLEPVDPSTIIDQATAGELLDGKQEQEVELRYRPTHFVADDE
jgi:hypothetical protein